MESYLLYGSTVIVGGVIGLLLSVNNTLRQEISIRKELSVHDLSKEEIEIAIEHYHKYIENPISARLHKYLGYGNLKEVSLEISKRQSFARTHDNVTALSKKLAESLIAKFPDMEVQHDDLLPFLYESLDDAIFAKLDILELEASDEKKAD